MKKIIITISILILIAIIFIGYKSDLFGKKEMKDTSVIIKDYINMMIPHHEEAVHVSLPIMNDLSIEEPKVRILAANIVDTQSFEIEKMKNIYRQYLGGEYIVSSSTNSHTMTKDNTGKDYVKNMIKHHELAIESSKDFIKKIDKYKKYNSVKKDGLIITNSHPAIDESYDLAKSIIESQSKEIELMKELY